MRRKPTEQKKLHGTHRAERDRPTLQFADSKGIADRPPTYVRQNKLAFAEWKRVAPHLEAEGVLKEPDVSSFAVYTILYSRWREAASDVEKNGQTIIVISQTRTGKTEKPVTNPAVRNEVTYASAMMRAAAKFGLNPLDRPRVESPPGPDDEDALQRFINDSIDDDIFVSTPTEEQTDQRET
jgi:P27 family predicted phage terminase small subunit